MFDMFMNSVKLFFAGKLFRDKRDVLMQWLKGFGVCLTLLLALGWFVSPLAGVVVASLVGGYIQPLLFKDLKYA
jgi:hypothetical protein